MTTNVVNIIMLAGPRISAFGRVMTERKTTRETAREDGEAEEAFGGLAPSKSASRRRGGRADLDVLTGHLGYFLRRVQVWVFQDFIRALSEINIRPAQYSVLVMIGANPGLSQADVSAMLGIERARLVRLLDRLEKRGLTKRMASPSDRRSHALQLTAGGRATLKRAKALAATHEQRLRDRLGPAHHRAMMDTLRDFDLSR
jgi:DNA-binding MarR family transcriptional regulator